MENSKRVSHKPTAGYNDNHKLICLICVCPKNGELTLLAMVVFFSHSRLGSAVIDISPFDFLDRLVRIFSTGSLAVSFFFTLSGYLITYLIIEERENTGQFHLGNFYLRRMLRIWPLYYAVLLFSFFIYPWVKVKLGYVDQNPYDIFYQVLFLSNFDSLSVDVKGLVGVAPMMININWSIAIEEQFYLFWPLLFLLTGVRKFCIIILSVIIVSWLARTFLFAGPELYYHTLSVISDLGVGALLAYVTFYNRNFVLKIEVMSRYTICIVYVFGIIFIMYGDVFSSVYLSHRLLSTLFFSFVIIEQNFAGRSFYKFGHSPFLTSLGKYTYSLYLLHPIGIQVSILIFRFLNWNWEIGFQYAVLYAIIAFIVAMILSLLSYHYIEKFFLSLRNRFYIHKRNPLSI